MSKPSVIGIVETGAGNIRSLQAAIERSGRECVRLNAPDTATVDQLVIPGQGRFGPVMSHLQRHGWVNYLRDWIQHDKPLLGICVGLQILFRASEENPGISGLCVFDHSVNKLHSPKQPMMGWADIHWENKTAHDQVYFVNSFVAPVFSATVARCEYGQAFSAVVQRGNLTACQFHPEKSGATGMRLLQQWLC